MKISKPAEHPAPKHLGKRANEFWRALDEQFVFEAADLQRLLTACQCIDTVDAAEVALRKHGMFCNDRYGGQRPHPAVNVARDARQLLLRSLRELSIDIELPVEPRIPSQARRYA